MRMPGCAGVPLCLVLVFAGGTGTAGAAVTQLQDPAGMSPPVTVIDFEGYPHLTAADTLYQSSGVRFSRDDGGQTAIYDPGSYEVHSGSNFIGTPSWAGAPGSHTRHLNVAFTSPMREVGGFFGNDRAEAGVFDSLRLSVFDASDELIGTVSVVSNRNGNADQFIGLRSDAPFTRARFEHDAEGFGVGIDDLHFTTIPEPAGALALLCVSASLLRWRHPFGRSGRG